MPIELILPAVSPDFEAGNIAKWHKAVGDRVEVGDVIVDVETDKAMVEIEATESGVLGRILFDEGSDDVVVNSVLGLLLEAGESADDLVSERPGATAMAAESAAPAEASKPPAMAAAEAVTSASSTPRDPHRIFASPLARRIAAQKGIDLSGLAGRGPKGRILKADVEAAVVAPVQRLSKTSANDRSGDGYTAIPHSNIRKVIARRLSDAKRNIPHFYLSVDFRVDALVKLRAEANAQAKDGEYKLSVNDFVIKACALALRDVPEANASWTEEAIHQYHNVDVSVAVATPSGLITPIVFDADQKNLVAISNEVKELAAKARDGKLKPHEYQGGGFSVSNLGMFGIDSFSAIVNPPQSCILAVGASVQKPVVQGGEMAVATIMNATLSVDHRSVDGAVGAQFMQALKHYIEQPMTLLLK